MKQITNGEAVRIISHNIINNYKNLQLRWQLFIAFGFIAPSLIFLDILIFKAQPQYVTIRSIAEYLMFGLGMLISTMLNIGHKTM